MLGAGQARADDTVELVWTCRHDNSAGYRIRCMSPDAVVDIPTYGAPYRNSDLHVQLAKAVLCRRNPACQVTFVSTTSAALAPVRR
jgi:hypothetical protein